jgi:glucose-1-phosphate thymidylyltransferase
MEIAKALILTGRGRDDGRCPNSSNEPRHLFPVANRPLLFHNLASLRAAGVLETTILTDAATAGVVETAVGDGRDWGLSVRYAMWEPDSGVAGAVAAGREFVRDEPVLVQQGDALLRERLHPHVSSFARERLDALALQLQQPAAEAVPLSMPWYLLSPKAISVLGDAGRPDANPVTGVQAQGGRVRVQLVDGCMPCRGDVDGLLESNRSLLEHLQPSVDPASVEESRIQGAVEIHPTAKVRRSIVRGPAIIGPGAEITDAYIGPYSSIGAGVVVEGSEIEYSIVLPEAELRFIGTRLESSVIGRRARIVREFRNPQAIRMSVGDGAEVVLT